MLCFLRLSLAAILLAMGAYASPVQWTSASGGNDHWYEYVNGPINWTDARAAALGRVHLGLAGYLVTITSVSENTFVAGLVPAAPGSSSRAWIGLSDAAVEGEWRWMDGPEAGLLAVYTNWAPGEPNNVGGAEHYGEIAGELSYAPRGMWNDLPNGGPSPGGYIVEYSGRIAEIPEPKTWTLIGLGMGGLALRRSRLTARRRI